VDIAKNLKHMLGRDVPYFEDKGNQVTFKSTDGSSCNITKPLDASGKAIEFFKTYTLEALRDFAAENAFPLPGETPDITIAKGTQFPAEFKPNLHIHVQNWRFPQEPEYGLDYRIV
jgi:hypothetical protein